MLAHQQRVDIPAPDSPGGNIRNKSDKSGKVLYRLMQGAQVTRLAEQGAWFQVGLRSGAIAWGHRSIFEPAH